MRTTTSQQGKRCTWWRSLSSSFATALLAAAPLVASAQTGNATRNDGMVGAATLKGQTEAQIVAAKVADDEVGSLSDPSKVFFFYNVKTGKFLSMGGYWGVHAALKDTPVAFWAQDGRSTAINFVQDLKTQQGNQMRWVPSISNSGTDEGVFLDRGDKNQAGYNGWFLEEVNDGTRLNTYRLYTRTFNTDISSKVYLSALGDVASQKNCDADSKSNLTKNGLWDEHTLWRVISLKQIQDLMAEASENLTDPLDLTFNLACPGFDRGRMDIDAWKSVGTNVAAGGYARIGLEQCYDKFVPTNSVMDLTRSGDDQYEGALGKESSKSNYAFPYKGDQPQKFTNGKDYKRHMAKYFCMDVHGVHGYIYQKQNVTKPGTYVIECKGYSNTPKALLFAGIGQINGSGLVEGTKRTTTLNQVSNMPADEQARLHVDEQNMDYAGKEFYESSKYTNSVIVQVTQEMIEDAKNAGQEGVSIAFGLNIGDGSQTPSLNDWTVFDDFRLIYVSNTKNEDLVLDELRGDLEYLKNGITYKNRVLRLAKTFKQNSWNSFVLPVDLTVKQLRDAFGGTVRLAKLNNLTDTELQFETVTLDGKADKDIALDAYQPYIIFPSKTMEDNNNSPYTATIAKNGSTENPYKVTIQAQRFEIPGVTFATNTNNENDLSNMDDYWTTKLTHDVGTITAYGTFVRTFDPEATQDETGVWSFSSRRGEIRQDYYDLKGSYFFDHGDVYYSDRKVRGLRGFSCWFKPNTNNGTKPAVYLDGVEQEAELTSIGELIVGPEAANRYGKNDGVYNLQGQRVGNTTEGLPSGIYIVNGRKHVVR